MAAMAARRVVVVCLVLLTLGVVSSAPASIFNNFAGGFGDSMILLNPNITHIVESTFILNQTISQGKIETFTKEQLDYLYKELERRKEQIQNHIGARGTFSEEAHHRSKRASPLGRLFGPAGGIFDSAVNFFAGRLDSTEYYDDDYDIDGEEGSESEGVKVQVNPNVVPIVNVSPTFNVGDGNNKISKSESDKKIMGGKVALTTQQLSTLYQQYQRMQEQVRLLLLSKDTDTISVNDNDNVKEGEVRGRVGRSLLSISDSGEQKEEEEEEEQNGVKDETKRGRNRNRPSAKRGRPLEKQNSLEGVAPAALLLNMYGDTSLGHALGMWMKNVGTATRKKEKKEREEKEAALKKEEEEEAALKKKQQQQTPDIPGMINMMFCKGNAPPTGLMIQVFCNNTPLTSDAHGSRVVRSNRKQKKKGSKGRGKVNRKRKTKSKNMDKDKDSSSSQSSSSSSSSDEDRKSKNRNVVDLVTPPRSPPKGDVQPKNQQQQLLQQNRNVDELATNVQGLHIAPNSRKRKLTSDSITTGVANLNLGEGKKRPGTVDLTGSPPKSVEMVDLTKSPGKQIGATGGAIPKTGRGNVPGIQRLPLTEEAKPKTRFGGEVSAPEVQHLPGPNSDVGGTLGTNLGARPKTRPHGAIPLSDRNNPCKFSPPISLFINIIDCYHFIISSCLFNHSYSTCGQSGQGDQTTSSSLGATAYPLLRATLPKYAR